MKRRDKPHPPLSSPTDLSIRDNRRLANLQEKNDNMTYSDFHFTTFSPQLHSLNDFLLGHSNPERQLAFTFFSEPNKETHPDLGMKLPSMPPAEILPNCQLSGNTEQVSSVWDQVCTRLTRLIHAVSHALSPRVHIDSELICKPIGLEFRFKANINS